jgi:hypothetical protein
MTIIGVLAVVELHTGRSITRRLDAGVARCARQAGASGAAPLGARPLVVTPDRLFPQVDFSDFDRYQWLAPERADLPTALGTLHTAGARRFVLVDNTPAADLSGSPYRLLGRCANGVELAGVAEGAR